jgi:uncharacterized protein YqgC (DUF456 family)
VLIALEVGVAMLLLLGLVGTFVPIIPGTALILGGIALHAVGHGFEPIGPWRLGLFVVLALLSMGLDYAAGALGVKRFGGSGWAVTGAVLGALVGVFMGPFGLVLGPVLGAVLAEWIYCRRLRTSLVSGLGTVVGMLVGAAAKFGLSLVMIGLFVYWLWAG